jgi:hypothetical protein
MAHHRSSARRGLGAAEPEAVRIRLLGGFRVCVGPRISEGMAGGCSKRLVWSSFLPWRRDTDYTGSRSRTLSGQTSTPDPRTTSTASSTSPVGCSKQLRRPLLPVTCGF